MKNERFIKMRLIDIKRQIGNLEEGNGTLLEQTHKDLIIASLKEKQKLLEWILEGK